MDNLMVLLGGGFKDPASYESQPVDASPEEAATFMVGAKKITVMTGAGVSVASGIPTFMGPVTHEYQTKSYATESDPTQVLMYKFFKKYPMAVWEWSYDFLKRVSAH